MITPRLPGRILRLPLCQLRLYDRCRHVLHGGLSDPRSARHRRSGARAASGNGSHTLWSVPAKSKNSQMGPLIDTAAVARVDRIVEDSTSYAKVIVRGGPVTDGPLASGAFYRPSLIEVEDLSAPIIQQEVFGPVATFEIFDDENDAIHRANATEFGLAAAGFTRDIDRARRVSRQINAGTVWTNTWLPSTTASKRAAISRAVRPPAGRPRPRRHPGDQNLRPPRVTGRRLTPHQQTPRSGLHGCRA